MHKIALIIKREYLTRVKQKSFIIMTILGPLLMGALFVVPIWMAMQEDEKTEVLVVDESLLFNKSFTDKENLKFHFVEGMNLAEAEKQLDEDYYSAVLYIPQNIINSNGAEIIYKKQPGFNTITFIEGAIENELESLKLAEAGIDKKTLAAAKTDIKMRKSKYDGGVKESKNTELSMVVGMLGGVLIYFFIFLYGAQVMRGVIEEKSSRIVEVIISSVKPFELMMGKIIGIALVGLTQFLLWIILTSAVVSGAQAMLGVDKNSLPAPVPMEQTLNGQQSPLQPNLPGNQNADAEMDELWQSLDKINFPLLIGVFIFYFLGGYLLYGALFAAVGAAVDNEADTQQFMLPITIPLILSFVMAQFVMNNPEGQLAFWLSIIPFTSPIIMMVRLPFGIPYPYTDLWISMALLVVGFIATTWFAGKIYRTGILMYGKKVNYKELWKWIRYH
jgi:ABC-2 type transport system permease protein